MLRSALAVAAFVAAAPAFAGSVPVVSAAATVNPPVFTPAPPSSAVPLSVMSNPVFVSILNSANVQLVGASAGGSLPPGGISVQLQGLTPAQAQQIRVLLLRLGNASIIKPAGL